jgi:hypothetical protein
LLQILKENPEILLVQLILEFPAPKALETPKSVFKIQPMAGF